MSNTQGANKSGTTHVSSESTTSASQTSNNSTTTSSTYSIVKDGWGSRSNFQASYGLKNTPEDLEEGNAILKAMQDADARQQKG